MSVGESAEFLSRSVSSIPWELDFMIFRKEV